MAEGLGWGVVPPDLRALSQKQYADDDDASSAAPSTPGDTAAVPPEVIKAFLQSHNLQGVNMGNALSQESINALSTVDDDASSIFEASSSAPQQQHLHNPFAATGSGSSSHQNHQQQQQQHQGQIQSQSGSQEQKQHDSQHQQHNKTSYKPRKSLLRRILHGLLITGVSAGLLAAGAWAGTAVYRHYMSQLDDRDQLARKLAELMKAQDKLITRCTSFEHERDGLQDKAATLARAVSEGEAAQAKLRQRLSHMESDRDEAMRHNLNLQRKLTASEDAYAALSAAHKDTQAALDASKADYKQLSKEADKLIKEADKLASVVEKLENRCASVEAANSDLRHENSSLAAAVVHNKQQAAKLMAQAGQ